MPEEAGEYPWIGGKPVLVYREHAKGRNRANTDKTGDANVGVLYCPLGQATTSRMSDDDWWRGGGVQRLDVVKARFQFGAELFEPPKDEILRSR